MYMAALAILAQVNYKSKNHKATVLALETFFVKKELLNKEYINMLKRAKFKKENIDDLNLAKDKREIAQYSVTKKTTKRIAKQIKDDAYEFVQKAEELIAEIKNPEVS